VPVSAGLAAPLYPRPDSALSWRPPGAIFLKPVARLPGGHTLLPVELIPKAVVAGLFVQAQVLSTGSVNMIMQTPGTMITRDVINRIWSDVVKDYPYQGLQFQPNSIGGAFVGSGPEDAVIIQPPLIQIRDLVGSQGVRGSADKIESVVRTVVRHLSGTSPLNLGVKLVYNAPAPARDAVAFLLSEMLTGHDDLQQLAGGMEYQGHVKYFLKGEDYTYALDLEPLQADPEFIYIDLDVQYPGIVDASRIRDRILEADTFVSSRVSNFLDRRAEEWGK
jgi:hypothetical protein